MTSVTEHAVAPARRDYQRRVASLLDELEQRRRRVYFLQAGGARPAGLRDLKGDLQALRAELAALSAGASRRELSSSTHDDGGARAGCRVAARVV
jgi:hypothetical protein